MHIQPSCGRAPGAVRHDSGPVCAPTAVVSEGSWGCRPRQRSSLCTYSHRVGGLLGRSATAAVQSVHLQPSCLGAPGAVRHGSGPVCAHTAIVWAGSWGGPPRQRSSLCTHSHRVGGLLGRSATAAVQSVHIQPSCLMAPGAVRHGSGPVCASTAIVWEGSWGGPPRQRSSLCTYSHRVRGLLGGPPRHRSYKTIDLLVKKQIVRYVFICH